MEALLAIEPRTVTLEGARARLLPLEIEHAPALWAIGRDPAIWTWMLGRAWQSEADARAWIATAVDERTRALRVPFLIEDCASGRVAGTTSYLDIRRFDRSLEIGHTWLGTAFQRTPINTECKLLLLAHAFETLGAVRVQLKTDARNERSRAAILRIGARFEGVLRTYQRRYDDTWRDTAMYSVVRDEWDRVKRRLEEMALR